MLAAWGKSFGLAFGLAWGAPSPVAIAASPRRTCVPADLHRERIEVRVRAAAPALPYRSIVPAELHTVLVWGDMLGIGPTRLYIPLFGIRSAVAADAHRAKAIADLYSASTPLTRRAAITESEIL